MLVKSNMITQAVAQAAVENGGNPGSNPGRGISYLYKLRLKGKTDRGKEIPKTPLPLSLLFLTIFYQRKCLNSVNFYFLYER